ncbi:MAG TPA: PAS domain-containing protein [Rhizobacter sp.]|nr:PAS domain-containing protein [Rhizobacter sp.]
MPDRTVKGRLWLSAIENAAFGVWDLDAVRERVHYSPQWKARFGFPRIHEPDDTGFWRCRVHPSDLAPMQSSLRAHLDGLASSYEMRFRVRSNGSGYRTVLSRGRVVARDDRGKATRMLGTMVDLTSRPLAPVPRGLVTEDPAQTIAGTRLPLHAALGAVCTQAADAEAHQLVESIADLLDMALHESKR